MSFDRRVIAVLTLTLGILFARAALTTGAKRSRLCAMLQLMFFRLNVSEAAPHTAPTLTP